MRGDGPKPTPRSWWRDHRTASSQEHPTRESSAPAPQAHSACPPEGLGVTATCHSVLAQWFLGSTQLEGESLRPYKGDLIPFSNSTAPLTLMYFTWLGVCKIPRPLYVSIPHRCFLPGTTHPPPTHPRSAGSLCGKGGGAPPESHCGRGRRLLAFGFKFSIMWHVSNVWDTIQETEAKTEVPVTPPDFQTLSQGQQVWESGRCPLLLGRPSSRWRCPSSLGPSGGKLIDLWSLVWRQRASDYLCTVLPPLHKSSNYTSEAKEKELFGFLSNTFAYFRGTRSGAQLPRTRSPNCKSSENPVCFFLTPSLSPHLRFCKYTPL